MTVLTRNRPAMMLGGSALSLEKLRVAFMYKLVVRRIIERALMHLGTNDWHVAEEPTGHWILVDRRSRQSVPRPTQGWKLHLSAHVWSADAVLDKALPILFNRTSAFKVASSNVILDKLNEGLLGRSQVGKFATIYPATEDEAVQLALLLEQATLGLDGPPIPSDRPLRSGSLVHYRYGSFGGKFIMLSINETYPALVTPNGTVIPDRPTMVYRPPDWAHDPFVEARVAENIAPQSRIVAKRYVRVGILHQSSRGSVELAVGICPARKCVIKRARPGARSDLRRESQILTELDGCGAPIQYELLEHGSDLLLVMEYIEGQSLGKYISDRFARHEPPSLHHTLIWGQSILDSLETLYTRALICCDLKPDNVIVTPDGKLRLIDFEHTYKIGAEDFRCLGTLGYASPNQRSGCIPNIQDTIFAFGSLMLFVYTGADPAGAPDPQAPLDRPIRLLRPGVLPSVEQIITCCLQRTPNRRYRSLEDLRAAWASISIELAPPQPALGGEQNFSLDTSLHNRYRLLAKRTVEHMCFRAREAPGQWLGSSLDNTGADAGLFGPLAGPILALTEAYLEFGSLATRAVLIRALQECRTPSRNSWRDGLYAGSVGTAAAMLRAGLVLGEEEWVGSAEEIGRYVAIREPDSPDLVEGLSGHIRFLLLLSDVLKRGAVYLDASIQAGDVLLAAADSIDDGLRWWAPTPQGKRAYFGYAHGAAGIADTLLDLFAVTGYNRFLEAARRTGQWLARNAVRVFSDGAGIDWPATDQDHEMAPAWCHGASGVGKFLLHLGLWDPASGGVELAKRAAQTAARGARGTFGSSQCHGLAGCIEFLLDMYQGCGDAIYWAEARSLARLLEAFARRRRHGVIWLGDASGRATDDFLVGQSGIALCLLRLADPGYRPHLISREGYRFGLGRTQSEKGMAWGESCEY